MLNDKIASFLDFERKNGWFSVNYKGVHYWNFLRFNLYVNTIYESGVLDIPAAGIEVSWTNILSTLRQWIKQIYKRRQGCDLFFVRSEINRQVGGKDIDPYFFFLEHSGYHLHEHAKSFISAPKQGSNLAPIAFSVAFCKLICKVFTPRIPELAEILNRYNETFSKNESYHKWAKYVNLSVSVFLIGKRYYHRVLKRGAKCVLFKCYYDRLTMALIAAARELKIPTVELQHGVMGKYHIAYQMQNAKVENSYCPDYLLTYGEYWSNTAHMPASTRMIDAGSPLMELSKAMYATAVPDPYALIVYSSGPDEPQLCDLALELARILPSEYRVSFKVHPGERHTWKSYYPMLAASSQVQCIDANITVHELFSRALHHVGSASTALFEALAFNGNVYVYESNASEYLDDVIASGDAVQFKDAEQLKRLLKNEAPFRQGRDTSYFKPGAKETILLILEGLIEKRHAK